MVQSDRRPARLVVVDDSPTSLRLMESVLSQAGFEVLCIAEGAKALGAIRRARPRVVFLDSTLPGVDVLGLCQTLGEDQSLADMDLVLMTTRAEAGTDLHRAVSDRITKPFTPEALLALLDHLLTRNRAEIRGRRRGLEAAQASGESAAMRILAEGLAVRLEPDERRRAILGERLRQVLSDPLVGADLWAAARDTAAAPALLADLERMPLPEILQGLALQRQTGILTADRNGMRIHVAFKDGAVRLVVGDGVGPEFLLGNILVREGLLEAHELTEVLQNRRGTTRRLGRQVVQLGYVSAEDLRRALWRQSSELIYELLRWRHGRYEFRNTDDLPPEMLDFELGVGIEALLMEGYRRVDEWGLIEKVLPSFDVVPVRIEITHAVLAKLTPEERRVYDQVDGRRAVRDIMEAVGGGAFEVARLLYGLISARVITVESLGVAAEVDKPLIH